MSEDFVGEDEDMSPTPAPAAADAEELAALRTEVARLRGEADRRGRRAGAVSALRRTTAAVLAMLAAFGFVASVIGLWGAYTALNTDRWVATVAPLPKDPQVSAAVAQYATSQVFEVLDVEQRLREALPERAAFIAGPLTGQVRGYVQSTVTTVVRSDRFQPIWQEANRRAHAQAVAILEGRGDVVRAQGERVSIDLLPLINQVLRELSARLPTMFGRKVNLPDLSSGAIPAGLRTRIQDAVGVPLPANFAQFTVYDAGKLAAAQRAVVTLRRDLVLLVAGTVLLLVLALLLAPRRRRTVLQFGLWLVVAAVAATAALRAARAQVLARVPGGTYRDGVAAGLTTVTRMLHDRGVQTIWLGAVLAALAYLAGPGRVPRWLRARTAAGARAVRRWLRTGTRAAVAYGPGWIAAHRDAVRVGGGIVAIALALLLSSWTGLLVVAVALAAFEVLVTLTTRGRAPA